MKQAVSVLVLCIAGAISAGASDMTIPYNIVSAPVVHAGQYHVLSCRGTFVVLDGSRGMTIAAIGRGNISAKGILPAFCALENGRLMVVTAQGSEAVELDQARDPAARLQIIDQGEDRVAARVFFDMNAADGVPRGSGTLDIYLYEDRIHLVPSVQIDYTAGGTLVTKAGFIADIPGKSAELVTGGAQFMAQNTTRFVPFGPDSTGFSLNINNPGRPSVKIGWLRNRYPAWLYMREIGENPETEELYEKWPPWVTQRGGGLVWTMTDNSGFIADFSTGGLERVSLLWANGDTLRVPDGGYSAFNGVMGLFLGNNGFMANELWKNHESPVKPVVQKGDFRYYNEIEGLYEIDSKGDDVDVTFQNMKNTADRPLFARVWNLTGFGGYEAAVNGKDVPVNLYNDGDIIDDPMVTVVKTATGPARFAGISCVTQKGAQAHITLTRKPGMQLTYQMYSELETYEAWSDNCTGNPLFSVFLTRGELSKITLPGKDAYAVFKLPLYWLKNGVNLNTFMNRVRGFTITRNGPDAIALTITAVNLQATGLSQYTVQVPYIRDSLLFDITAEFTPLDNGVRWSTIEYCDLYPFDNVYRRTFHYRDVTFLNSNGVFDRVGTGAWGGRFETTYQPDGLGYFGHSATREGPGSRCPDGADGTVWILGDNPQRGNILYRRGEWAPTRGARSVFSLCNAWVDIHNTVSGRETPSAGETINYTIEVFGGTVPTLEELNALYVKAAGGATIRRVTGVTYDGNGGIAGFTVK